MTILWQYCLSWDKYDASLEGDLGDPKVDLVEVDVIPFMSNQLVNQHQWANILQLIEVSLVVNFIQYLIALQENVTSL